MARWAMVSAAPIIAVLLMIFAGTPLYGDVGAVDKSTRQLMILTSFPPEFYGPFITKFNKSRPDIRVLVLNKKTTAAIAEIMRGNTRQFDLFWSSSADAFVVLKESERLRRSEYIPHYQPISKHMSYHDEPHGLYHNFALSGVGFMWNQKTLDEAGIASPLNWQDLTDTRFYGQVAMSSPSRSGTNHLIVESILQDMGWNEGWRFLVQLASNMKTITARSFRVPDGVAGGRFGVGLVIDFLAFAKNYADGNNHFTYGEPTFLMPARVALLQNGRNRKEAVAFIDYLLSKEGQDVLLSPAINRLPVSKEPFADYEVKVPYLISLIRQGKTKNYNTELSTKRYHLVNTLFDQLITYRLLDRKRVWKKLLDLEMLYGSKRPELIELRKMVLDEICTIPVTEEQSFQGKLPELFSVTGAIGQHGERKRQLFQEWDDFITNQLSHALEIIEATRKELSLSVTESVQ